MSIIAKRGEVIRINDTEIFGDQLMIVGNNNKIYGNYCHVKGNGNLIEGADCVVAGRNNQCPHGSIPAVLVYGKNSFMQTKGVQAILNPAKRKPRKRKTTPRVKEVQEAST